MDHRHRDTTAFLAVPRKSLRARPPDMTLWQQTYEQNVAKYWFRKCKANMPVRTGALSDAVSYERHITQNTKNTTHALSKRIVPIDLALCWARARRKQIKKERNRNRTTKLKKIQLGVRIALVPSFSSLRAAAIRTELLLLHSLIVESATVYSLLKITHFNSFCRRSFCRCA